MNFNRHDQIKPETAKTNSELIGKLRQLSVVKRVYLYILLMAAIGGGMGEIKYRLESKHCLSNDSCWIIQPTTRRAREFGVGALAGMITATLISIPALLEEN